MKIDLFVFAVYLLAGFCPVHSFAQKVLLFEDYESSDFAAKGRYDGMPDKRSSSEHKNGSYSYEANIRMTVCRLHYP